MQFLKKYWDIPVAIVLAVVSGVLENWELKSLQLTYYIIMLTFVYDGCLRIMRASFLSPNRKTKDKEVSSNPAQVGEQRLGELVIETVKGGKKIVEKIKKVFKWIWMYKEQLVALIGDFAFAVLIVYAYIFDKFGWLLQCFPQTQGWEIAMKIVVGVLSVLFIALNVRNTCVKRGLGSLEYGRNVLKGISDGLMGKLSIDTKKRLKNALSEAKKALKVATNNLALVESQYNSKFAELQSQQEFIKQLIAVGADGTVLTPAQSKAGELTGALNQLAIALNEAKHTVSQAESQVASYEKALEQ